MFELLLSAAAIGAMAKIANADDQSGGTWGLITAGLVFCGLVFVPLPFLRVLLAAIVAFILMIVSKVAASR